MFGLNALKEHKMDCRIRGALIGMTFGDAYINIRNRLKDGKYKYESSEIRIVHSLDQMDYCQYKCDCINKWLDRHAELHEHPNGVHGQYRCTGFSTSHPYFREIKRWCYPFGVKTYTEQNLSMLTPQGIAFWYMDDGSCRRNVTVDGWVHSVSTSIATYCSKKEVELIVDWFNQTYKIGWNIRYRKGSPDNKAFFIETNTKGSHDFAALVSPFIIPSMKYKLAHVAAVEAHERQTPVGVCKCGRLIYAERRKGLCDACYARKRRENYNR